MKDQESDQTVCRGCEKLDLVEQVNFGPQPLAGEYPKSITESLNSKKFILDLHGCSHCGLLQVTNLPPISAIFNEDYRYSSSTIPALKEHFCDFARSYSYIMN